MAKLSISEPEVRYAIAEYLKTHYGITVPADKVTWSTHVVGEYEDSCEVIDGAEVEYPVPPAK